mmetsp:Transcript_3621/g.6933  ORF Transcript_3621/g.6933 Transcript_3621/m.6933 type:complete len:85 (-) Transcript_3621:235-489(-)
MAVDLGGDRETIASEAAAGAAAAALPSKSNVLEQLIFCIQSLGAVPSLDDVHYLPPNDFALELRLVRFGGIHDFLPAEIIIGER